MKTMYYKFLSKTNVSEFARMDYSEYLPKDGKPGPWLPKIEHIEPCASGYHGCEKKDLISWINDDLYVVQFRGNMEREDDKVVAQEMRFIRKVKGWNEKNLRLAAADIVEQISLPIWKKYHPDDTTLEDVIDVVRRYARGKASDTELSAAWSAAESAAWSAAREIVFKRCGLIKS